MSEFNGYKVAEKIDKIINETLKRYPIGRDRYRDRKIRKEWIKLERTVETSLRLIREELEYI